MSNMILLVYYVLLTVGMYFTTYGSSKNKNIIDWCGTIIITIALLFLMLNSNNIDDVNVNFNRVASIISCILVLPVRLKFKKKWTKDYQKEKFEVDYEQLYSNFARESGLFKNAVDVKKFALAPYIKTLKEYEWYLLNVEAAVSRWENIAKSASQEDASTLYVTRKCMEKASTALNIIRNRIIMEKSEDIVKDVIKDLAKIMCLCAYPDKNEEDEYHKFMNAEEK